MRDYDANTAAYLADRTAAHIHILYWFKAKNRTTGAVETLGLWTGDDHQDFTIGGDVRTYYGAGTVAGTETLTYETGLSVRTHRIPFKGLKPEIEQLLKGYDPRLAPVEMHRVFYDPDTAQQIAPPTRIFTGSIDAAPVTVPAKGGTVKVEVAVVGAARSLTIPLSLKKSDEVQKLRGGDRFRRYIDVSGQTDVWWGETRASTSPPPAPVTTVPER
ncbi:hypothetical protein TG4357_03311 [Thalassovita gelatinovora]|uniref:Uncharacterized protein n=1 Tax=Thalassovita gelatinovora TaxID=53501 RepID=A0A0P1FJJ7_THAGE|nr:hypothetical protein [Thalassovita gelatinovora]QIZ81557.1 hypothetical protein HFZ77_14250 [Thalassovita gelatinovora]CUH67964.1 hypothetical protein TG4357_03311 [Thalassovita gelatinovora]SEQ26467.1 hypothetical protein SAMN04488043_104182 [Thalassovita gelatinovora]